MKTLQKILATILLGAACSSCDLTLIPEDTVTPQTFFKTETDLRLWTNQFYTMLESPDNAAGLNADDMVDKSMGDVIAGTRMASNEKGWTWTALRKINYYLANSHNCTDEAVGTKYVGVAYFFRAYFYYEKVLRYGDVPWYDIQLGSADELLYKPRDSRELILTKMLEDIDYAINSGGLTESAADPYHVNKWAALALKAQFCLYEGTYRKYHNLNLDGHDANFYLDLAAKAALEIIEKGPYKLYQTGHPEKDYLTLFAQKDASPEEYILAIKFDYAIGARHNASAYTLLPTQGRPGLTRKFINTYLMDNGTAFTDKPGWQEMQFIEETDGRDPRLAQSIRTPGYTRIGQTEVEGPMFETTVTGYQPVKFVQDPTSNSNNNDRLPYRKETRRRKRL